jgi:hypothetical protein
MKSPCDEFVILKNLWPMNGSSDKRHKNEN